MSRDARTWRVAVAVAVAIAGLVAGLFPIFDGDLFWHLASGRWIVEHGTVPRVDPFRFSAPGLPWVDHEWLFQVVVFGIERAVGLDGLIVVRAAALAGFGLLLLGAGRRAGIGAAPGGIIALGAILGVRPRFLDRPEIVTLFAIVLLLSLLEEREKKIRLEAEEKSERIRFRDDTGKLGLEAEGKDERIRLREKKNRGSDLVSSSVGRVGGVVLLVVVWVNFHGEALLAPGLAGLFLLGAALDGRGTGARARAGLRAVGARWREWVGVPALLAVALLVNPYGWRLITVPLGIRAALPELGAVNPEWLSAFRAPQPYLFGGLAVVATVAVASRLENRRWPALRWGLPALALAVVALGAVRHQALFYAAAAPYAARCLVSLRAFRPSSFSEGLREGRREPGLGRGRALTVVVALLVAAWCAFPPSSGPLRPRHGGLRLGLGLAPGRFPVRLTELVRSAPAGTVGPLYNEFLHGGYLIWRWAPARQVFHDGRMELEPALLRELVAARRSAASWGELLRGRGAAGALVRYETRRVPVLEPVESASAGAGVEIGSGLRVVDARTANDLLFPAERWDLVDWDDEAMLFLARGEHAWPGAPYRFARPEDPERLLRRAAVDPAFRSAVREELLRKLAGQPDCARARTLLDAIDGGVLGGSGAGAGSGPAGGSAAAAGGSE